jgi:glucose-specific phosphotransferase system IIA component
MSRVEVLAPFSGRVVLLDDVPDPVFSERMLGDGLAVDPTEGIGVAPVTGKLVVFHSAGHAFAVQATPPLSPPFGGMMGGIGVLVHVGLDTVQMRGEGFTRLAEVGDEVAAGQEIVHFDLAAIEAAGYSPLSPVILPDLPEGYQVEKTTAAAVRAGQDVLFTVTRPD